MKYTAIILTLVLISVICIIYESESAYAMKTVNSNWHKMIPTPEVNEIKKEANMKLRDSKATSFVPTFTFNTDNTISKSYDLLNRHTNNNRAHHLN